MSPEIPPRRSLRELNTDCCAAIEEMAALDGPARSPADGWLREAKARVAADAALTALSAKAVAGIGQAATP